MPCRYKNTPEQSKVKAIVYEPLGLCLTMNWWLEFDHHFDWDFDYALFFVEDHQAVEAIVEVAGIIAAIKFDSIPVAWKFRITNFAIRNPLCVGS